MPDFMEECRAAAAQIWCQPQHAHKVMDPDLAESIAIRLSLWMTIAAQEARNRDFYHDLVIQIGRMLGEPAYRADDGSRSDGILCAKVPSLVAQALHRG